MGAVCAGESMRFGKLNKKNLVFGRPIL
jgi:hypothetical protein